MDNNGAGVYWRGSARNCGRATMHAVQGLAYILLCMEGMDSHPKTPV
jgi:hypothetical protein